MKVRWIVEMKETTPISSCFSVVRAAGSAGKVLIFWGGGGGGDASRYIYVHYLKRQGSVRHRHYADHPLAWLRCFFFSGGGRRSNPPKLQMLCFSDISFCVGCFSAVALV